MADASIIATWWRLRGSRNHSNSDANTTNDDETGPGQGDPSACTTPADFCLMDMHVCPDGSMVARDARLCCAFPSCPDESDNSIEEEDDEREISSLLHKWIGNP